jgi:hypothetical protein
MLFVLSFLCYFLLLTGDLHYNQLSFNMLQNTNFPVILVISLLFFPVIAPVIFCPFLCQKYKPIFNFAKWKTLK